MLRINLAFAWSWIVVGLISGAVQGIRFHHEDHLGGYASWTRRLTRLGHIAFLGTALLNIAFALTAAQLQISEHALLGPGVLFIIGAVAMPVVCYLSAWRAGFRRLFFLPVLSLGGAATWFAVLTWTALEMSLNVSGGE